MYTFIYEYRNKCKCLTTANLIKCGQKREGGGAARFVKTDSVECRAFLTKHSADFLRFSALELGYQIMREKERM